MIVLLQMQAATKFMIKFVEKLLKIPVFPICSLQSGEGQ